MSPVMEALEARQLLSAAPTVSIAAVDAWGSESGTNPGIFRISRVGGSKAALAVKTSLAGSTAANGVDYNLISWTQVTIPLNAAYVDAKIVVKNDLLVESTETVVMTLVANTAYKLGTAKTATVKIADDDYRVYDYLPLAAGSTWDYLGTYSGFPTDSHVTVAVSDLNGNPADPHVFDYGTLTNNVGGPTTATYYVNWSADLRLQFWRWETPDFQNTCTGAITIIPGVAEMGKTYTYSGAYTGYNLQNNWSGTQSFTTKLLGLETLSFNGNAYSTLKTQITWTWQDGSGNHGTRIDTYWMAQGVGIIKHDSTLGSSTFSLTAYSG
jgi:hypothetical protein